MTVRKRQMWCERSAIIVAPENARGNGVYRLLERAVEHGDPFALWSASPLSMSGRLGAVFNMDPYAAPEGQSCGFAIEDASGLAYDEHSFRHLLTIERKRAGRSQRPLLVLLLKLKREPRNGDRIPSAIASRLFEGLSSGLREIDFVGWYRAERIVGAVLPVVNKDPLAARDAARTVVQRVGKGLDGCLPAGVARRLHLRALLLDPRVKR